MKRIISILLCLLLLSSVAVFAVEEGATQEGAPTGQEMPRFGGGQRPNGGEMPQIDPNNMPRFDAGNMPQFDPNNMPQFDPNNMPQMNGERPQFGGGQRPQNGGEQGQTEKSEQAPATGAEAAPGGNMPWGDMAGMMPGAQQDAAQETGGILGFIKTNFTPILSLVLLALAFLFVKLYKRKTY